MEIVSPITNSINVVIENKIPTSWLISEYQRQLNIDVSRYFKDLNEIFVCKCLDTGYSFYHPFSTTGDSDFYTELEKFPWYYMNEKWEHNEAIKYVKRDSKVLEIGSGRGSFLKKVMERTEFCVGLELNESAVIEARKRGLNVLSESIDTHARTHRNYYDFVCLFQVLEHIPNINEFMISSMATLRTGGLLIICVPNNESFIFQENELIINMPPHHMGLWTLNALLKLQNYFSLRTETLQFEPIQPYHFGYGTNFLMKKFPQRHLTFLQRVVAKTARIFIKTDPSFHDLAELSTTAFSPYLPGHSIMVVYRKVKGR